MRKIAFSFIAAAAVTLAQTASAADLGTAPIYRKAAPMVAPFTWTGSYIGGYIGGATASRNTTTSDPNDGSEVGGAFTNLGLPATYKTGSSFIGGYTGGYNYQFAPNWLIGYEGETGYIKLKGSGAYPETPTAVGQTEMGSLYSAWTARLGYVTDQSLLYVKGGAALARFETAAYIPGGGVSSFAVLDHKYVLGYAVGAGWEYAIDPKWSVKAEYLYLGFEQDYTFSRFAGVNAGAPWTTTTKLSGVHTGKVGLNYKWDWFNLLR